MLKTGSLTNIPKSFLEMKLMHDPKSVCGIFY